MRPFESSGRLDDSEPVWNDEPQADGVGPQGEALILELQRLRQAFDHDDRASRRPARRPRDGSEPDPHRRANAPKRRRKGKMGQAIDVWLTQFGLKTAVETRGERDERSFGANAQRPGRRRPTIAPGEPAMMKKPVESVDAYLRGRNPTITPGEPAKMKRLREGITPRGPRRQRPTIVPDEPVTMNSAVEMYAPRGPRRKGPAIAAAEPAMMKRRPVEGLDVHPLRPREPAIPSGEPIVARRGVEPVVAVPPRSENPAIPHPTITHGDRIALELLKPGPVDRGTGGSPQTMLLASPGSQLPGPPKPGTPAAKLIEKSRTGLIAGVSFMLDYGAPPPPADDNLTVRARWSFERELRRGLRVLMVALVLGGGWLVFVPLAGAVVVPGNLVVQSNVKAIQHPTGGVVAEIKVKNGSQVQAGDLLIRLDATQAQTSLQVVSKQLDEVRAKLARLSAERDGLDHFEAPSQLVSRSTDENVASVLASEETLFKARFTARQSQKDLLQSKIAQLTQEISGLESQITSKAKQLELIQGELTGVQDLYDKHLVPLTRLTALQRESARIEGERGQLESTIAETKSKIGESQLQILRTEQDFRTDVVKDLGEAQAKEAELSERGVAARDMLDRIEMRSPTSGVIHQLNAHTIGGVIRAGDTIMEIVPDTDDLQIEARLQPQDIDQVHTGQTAFVRLSAFDSKTTPQLAGQVSYVSADTSKDQQSNNSYFTVRVLLPEEERRHLAGQQLVPGMPAEVFMQTGSRTMMNYLLKPILDQMRRAFVER
jgi:HlyD family secretion protein